MISKKDKEILVDNDVQEGEKDFTVVSLNESFFFYDSTIRRVWIYKGKRPVVRVTGSHKPSCIFGTMSITGKQLFIQYDAINVIHF